MLRLLQRAFWLATGAVLLGLWFGDAKAVTPDEFEQIVPERTSTCEYLKQEHVCAAVMMQSNLYFVIGQANTDKGVVYYAIYKLNRENVNKFFQNETLDLTTDELVWKNWNKERNDTI